MLRDDEYEVTLRSAVGVASSFHLPSPLLPSTDLGVAAALDGAQRSLHGGHALMLATALDTDTPPRVADVTVDADRLTQAAHDLVSQVTAKDDAMGFAVQSAVETVEYHAVQS